MSADVARRSRRIGVPLLAALGLLAWAGPASADETRTPCPPNDGPKLCIKIVDTDGVSRSPNPATGQPSNHMRYVVTVRNVGSRAVEDAELKIALTDLVSGHERNTTARLVAVTSSPDASSCVGTSNAGVSCDIDKLPAGHSLTATFDYTTSHTGGVEGTRLKATLSVDRHHGDDDDDDDDDDDGDDDDDDRRGSRHGDDDGIRASNVTRYENRPDFGASFVPATPTDVQVTTTLSALSFTSPGLESFLTEIEDFANDPSHCFKDVFCLPQTTRGDLTATGGVGPILWTRRLTDVPNWISASSIKAVHFHDPQVVTVNPWTDTFTGAGSFLKIDGIRFTTDGTLPGGLQPNVDYFVVKATATTFQVATKKWGNKVDITSSGTGTLRGERIRVIGDSHSERWCSCTTPPPKLPAIVARQVSKTVIDTCVWTSENGWMK